MFSLSNVVIQSSINTFGEVVIAGNSAASNIEGFLYASMNAFYQGVISFNSQNLGAEKMDRIYKSTLTALGCVLVIGLAVTLPHGHLPHSCWASILKAQM